jgi:hypothetical protein
MSLQIASPFQQFFDRDGSPLDNGFVYVGVVNQNPETNPLTIFFDDALTIPAAQPLRTSNGYIVRNGSPARLYTSQEDFSLTVREKNGVLVFTVADATSASNLATQFAQFVSDLADGSGSSLVGYNQGGVGAVDRTVEDRLRDFVSAKDFGAVGDGVADDTAAIQAWANDPSGFKVAEGTFNITAQIDLTVPNSTFHLEGASFITDEVGNFSPFRVFASGITFLGGKILGPYRNTTGPYPTVAGQFIDGAGNGAIRVVATYINRIDGLTLEQTEITGFGDYAVFAENVDRLCVKNCWLHHLGYNGIRTYGCFDALIAGNHIHHIYGAVGVGASPYWNAYGVTFTRRQQVPLSGSPLVVNPPSSRCAALNNFVHDITTWKALDSHGGKQILFDGNFGYNVYTAIGLDEGETSGTDDCPFEDNKVCNNVFLKGAVETGGIHRPMGVAVFGTSTNPGRGFEVFANTFYDYGGSSRAQISVGSAKQGKIFGNQLHDSVNAAINLLPSLFGECEIYDNSIYNLTGAIVSAIAIQTNTAKVKVGTNRHYASDTSTYIGVSLVAQSSGYYCDLDHQEADDPATVLYAAPVFGRTRGGNIWTVAFQGSGSPEGVVQGLIGMTYVNRTGGAGTAFWVKETNALNTGWAAK